MHGVKVSCTCKETGHTFIIIQIKLRHDRSRPHVGNLDRKFLTHNLLPIPLLHGFGGVWHGAELHIAIPLGLPIVVFHDGHAGDLPKWSKQLSDISFLQHDTNIADQLAVRAVRIRVFLTVVHEQDSYLMSGHGELQKSLEQYAPEIAMGIKVGGQVYKR